MEQELDVAYYAVSGWLRKNGRRYLFIRLESKDKVTDVSESLDGDTWQDVKRQFNKLRFTRIIAGDNTNALDGLLNYLISKE